VTFIKTPLNVVVCSS